MRKYFYCVLPIFLILFACVGCDVSSMSTLAEISMPYVGEYRCEHLYLGESDYSEEYDVRLTLKRDGTFTLSYRQEGGCEGEYSGNYTVDGEEITFSSPMGAFARTFSMQKGKITLSFPLGDHLLCAQFSII